MVAHLGHDEVVFALERKAVNLMLLAGLWVRDEKWAKVGTGALSALRSSPMQCRFHLMTSLRQSCSSSGSSGGVSVRDNGCFCYSMCSVSRAGIIESDQSEERVWHGPCQIRSSDVPVTTGVLGLERAIVRPHVLSLSKLSRHAAGGT